MEIMGVTGVAAISVIAYMLGELAKASQLDNKWIPVICGVAGGSAGAGQPVSGAGFSGHGCDKRSRSGHSVGPGGYRRKPDNKTDEGISGET